MRAIQLLEVLNLIKEETDGKTEMYLLMLHVFLLIVENEGITQTKLAKMLGVSEPTIHRAIRGLSIGIPLKKAERDKGTPPKQGLGLIRAGADENDWRSNKVFLSEKGQAFLERIHAI